MWVHRQIRTHLQFYVEAKCSPHVPRAWTYSSPLADKYIPRLPESSEGIDEVF